MSRIMDLLRLAEAKRSRSVVPFADDCDRPFQVLTVANNKGGIGKTTIAANLAVYLRALREDLPILVFSLDDQPTLDRMLAIGQDVPRETVATALRTGSLASAVRLGQYGIHYVPTDRDVSDLKRAIQDVGYLREVLARTDWHGLIIIDTKSDLEILTQSAVAASDLTLVPVKDQAALIEADRLFELLGRLDRRGRILLSLVDLRIKYNEGEAHDVLSLLVGEIRRRGHPLFETFLSRSPKVESLATNPSGRLHSILHGAPGSIVHGQMQHLAVDVLSSLGPSAAPARARSAPAPIPV